MVKLADYRYVSRDLIAKGVVLEGWNNKILSVRKDVVVRPNEFRLWQFFGFGQQRPRPSHFKLLIEDKNRLCHANYSKCEMSTVVEVCQQNQIFLFRRYKITINQVEILVDKLRSGRQYAAVNCDIKKG